MTITGLENVLDENPQSQGCLRVFRVLSVEVQDRIEKDHQILLLV